MDLVKKAHVTPLSLYYRLSRQIIPRWKGHIEKINETLELVSEKKNCDVRPSLFLTEFVWRLAIPRTELGYSKTKISKLRLTN